jgi:hypothetical protein
MIYTSINIRTQLLKSFETHVFYKLYKLSLVNHYKTFKILARRRVELRLPM